MTAANINDSLVFEALWDDVPAIKTASGRRRHRPGKVHADKAYDAHHCRAYLRRRGITARIARGGIESSQRLGRHRWRVERTLSWLSCYRRLAVRWIGVGPLVCLPAAGMCHGLLQPALLLHEVMLPCSGVGIPSR